MDGGGAVGVVDGESVGFRDGLVDGLADGDVEGNVVGTDEGISPVSEKLTLSCLPNLPSEL